MIYSANYGGWDPPRSQPVPVQTYTDETQPIPRDDPRMAVAYLSDLSYPRLAAKWWKVRPDLACPDAGITVWIDGSMTLLVPDLLSRAVEELGSDDALFMRHPWRDCIYDEREASHPNEKYDGQPTDEQVMAYRNAGHPAHWGLAHSGLIVRRNNRRVRAFDERWWQEIALWSIQDQLSLPFLLRTTPLRWHWWPTDPITAGWVRWGSFN